MKLSLTIFATAWSLVTGFSHHWPPASPALQHSDRVTWAEYDAMNIDPLVPHAEIGDMEHEECSAEEDDDCYWSERYFEEAANIDKLNDSKGEISNSYWKQKYADDQKKLHNLDYKEAGAAIKAAIDSDGIGKRDTWGHYEHEYIDDLHKPSEKAMKPVKNPMDAKKRAMADEYWAQKTRDEKEKMAKMSGMDLLP